MTVMTTGARRLTLAISCLALAGMVTVGTFRTVDSLGVVRMRSAAEVWQSVPARLPHLGDAALVPTLYAVALTLTVVGLFVLLWLAASVGDDQPVPSASRVSAVRPWLAAMLANDESWWLSPGRCAAFMLAIAVAVAWQLGAF